MYIIIIIMHVRAAVCIATELSSEHTCHRSRFHLCTRQLATGFRCHWKSGPNRNARLNLLVHRPSPSLGRRRLFVVQFWQNDRDLLGATVVTRRWNTTVF